MERRDRGKVTADYDKNFWLASLTVNETSTVKFSYDDDGLITGASTAAGTLTRQTRARPSKLCSAFHRETCEF